MIVKAQRWKGMGIKSCLASLPYFFALSAYDSPNTPSDLSDKFKVSSSGLSTVKDNACLRCSQSCLEQALFRHFGSDGGPFF